MSEPGTPPVTMEAVTIIGTGTGDGSPLKTGVVGTTPDHLPNLAVRVVSPIMAILIRFVNTYLTFIVGTVTAGMTSNLLPYHDFMTLLVFALKLGLSGSILAALKDCITIFGRLEGKFPLGTGSI